MEPLGQAAVDSWWAAHRGLGWGGGLGRKKLPHPHIPLLWPPKLLEFLDVLDDPVLGYLPPTVITILHVHLFSCAVDYRYPGSGTWGPGAGARLSWARNLPQPKCDPFPPRPLYLPVRVLVTAETFTLSSNIVMDTSTFLLRYATPPTQAPHPSHPKSAVATPSPGSHMPAVCPQASGLSVHLSDPSLRKSRRFPLPRGSQTSEAERLSSCLIISLLEVVLRIKERIRRVKYKASIV